MCGPETASFSKTNFLRNLSELERGSGEGSYFQGSVVKNENIYRRETLTKKMYVNTRERDFAERKLMEWLKRKTWLGLRKSSRGSV